MLSPKSNADEATCFIITPEDWLLDELSLPVNVILIGYVSDEELVYLYKNAFLFVYPSLYEGFGLPPLEAMGYGAPVLASKIPSISEVVADAAKTFDPLSENSLKESMDELINNPVLRKELSDKGYKRASIYTWERSANLLHKVVSK